MPWVEMEGSVIYVDPSFINSPRGTPQYYPQDPAPPLLHPHLRPPPLINTLPPLMIPISQPEEPRIQVEDPPTTPYEHCNGDCLYMMAGKCILSLTLTLVFIAFYLALYSKTNDSFIDLCTLYLSQARFGPAIFLHGEVWRLLVALLIHQNPIHLLVNAWGFLYIGSWVELRWGHLGMLSLFIFTGVVCGATCALIYPYAIAIGASGPIMSFLAANLVWVGWGPPAKVFNPEFFRVFQVVLHIFGIITTVVGDLVVSAGDDWLFHLTGIIMGFLIGGALLRYTLPNENNDIVKIVSYVCSGITMAWVLAVFCIGIWAGVEKVFKDGDVCYSAYAMQHQ